MTVVRIKGLKRYRAKGRARTDKFLAVSASLWKRLAYSLQRTDRRCSELTRWPVADIVELGPR